MSDSLQIFVCYLPGLDRRLVDRKHTPYISYLLTTYPSSRIRTLPSTELVPTLLTGVYPDQHHIFQVSLKNPVKSSYLDQLLRHVPDAVTVLFQGLYHLFNPAYDLPLVPWSRRHQFHLHRLKYTRRVKNPEALDVIGDIPSLFHLLGNQSRYLFVKRFDQMHQRLPSLPSGDVRLEFLEFYAFDLFTHWHLDQPEAMQQALDEVDKIVRNLHQQCQSKDIMFILLVDHGQEPIQGIINLQKLLRDTEVPQEEYVYFMELAVTRLWCKTNRARQDILQMLNAVEHLTVRTYQQMSQYNLYFEDDHFGQFFIFAEPGYIFFPHDFYHPLSNFLLGFLNTEQRPRLFNPRHRGNHGYLPDHPSEEGYMILVDQNVISRMERMNLIDFAPTLLALLGYPQPEHMRGQIVFTPARQMPFTPEPSGEMF